MLKRLLLGVALAASTLFVTGTVTGTAQASSPSICAPAHHRTTTAQDCKWRDDGCYYCYSYRSATWERQYCR
ncbi:hypothetical protein [Nonomuraea sp. B19D2]|uniref:hypothetical protein n=1 Tax=Nonomuraea sp. B19D2 TaxID=3159561 RepID=UPI0032DBC32B